ncbi:MAG: hypothetical protein IJR19_03200 [Lachnospiraceae bacterium]|nr:hypothetical protein [Lachnospiraceae bacterium]
MMHVGMSEYAIAGTLFRGKVNECYAARRKDSSDGSLYTLIVIHEHETVHEFLEIEREDARNDFERSDTAADFSGGSLIQGFSDGTDFILVFPYRPERLLDSFYVGEAYPLSQCEEICFNLILACLSSGLRYPILFQILDQKLINIARDDSIYFSYRMDLETLDAKRNERDCATRCADILLELLSSKEKEKSVVYELLSRKAANKSYSTFTELYRDLRIAAAPVKKGNLIQRIKAFFHRNADRLFGILFWIALIAGIVALVMLVTNLVVGDIPFLRLFYNSFQKIGTESLKQ